MGRCIVTLFLPHRLAAANEWTPGCTDVDDGSEAGRDCLHLMRFPLHSQRTCRSRSEVLYCQVHSLDRTRHPSNYANTDRSYRVPYVQPERADSRYLNTAPRGPTNNASFLSCNGLIS